TPPPRQTPARPPPASPPRRISRTRRTDPRTATSCPQAGSRARPATPTDRAAAPSSGPDRSRPPDRARSLARPTSRGSPAPDGQLLYQHHGYQEQQRFQAPEEPTAALRQSRVQRGRRGRVGDEQSRMPGTVGRDRPDVRRGAAGDAVHHRVGTQP